jgi:hypothetical protein
MATVMWVGWILLWGSCIIARFLIYPHIFNIYKSPIIENDYTCVCSEITEHISAWWGKHSYRHDGFLSIGRTSRLKKLLKSNPSLLASR